MKEKNKTQKGFIQIPLLIAIIVGVLVVVGGSYFGFRQYKNYQSQKLSLEKGQQSKQNEQNQEIEKLKKDVENLTKSQQKSTQQSTQQANPPPQNLSISASELGSYLSGVVEILCDRGVSGSGSLYTGGFVLTNFHVISGSRYCEVKKRKPITREAVNT